jgi:hypothetical protein
MPSHIRYVRVLFAGLALAFAISAATHPQDFDFPFNNFLRGTNLGALFLQLH